MIIFINLSRIENKRTGVITNRKINIAAITDLHLGNEYGFDFIDFKLFNCQDEFRLTNASDIQTLSYAVHKFTV